MAEEQKLLGFIPKSKYMQFAYMFLLVSAAGNALYSLLGVVGINFESATIGTMLLGLISAVLAGIALTKHKADFTPHDHAHCKYIIVMFVVFFAMNIVLGGPMYMVAYALGYLTNAALGVVQAAFVWTGFSSWQDGRVVTKNNFKDEFKIAIAKR